MTWAPISTAPTHHDARADLFAQGVRYTDCRIDPRKGWVYWGDDGYDGTAWIRVPQPITHWMPIPAEPYAPAPNEVATYAHSFRGVIVNSTQHEEGYFKHLVVVTDVTHSVPPPFELTDAQLTNLHEALERAMAARRLLKGL